MSGVNPIRRSVKQLNGFAACNLQKLMIIINRLWQKKNAKINDYYQSALAKKNYRIATILDPRFKAAFLKAENILPL